MKISKNKWLILLLSNIAPALLNLLLYRTGAMDDIYLFVPFFGFLTFLNYRNCDKVWQFLCIQLYMLVCIICSSSAETYIYYHNISNDFMTPVVGILVLIVEAGINIVTTIVAAIVMGIMKRKNILRQ